MIEEAGEDLLHPGVDPPFVVLEVVPGTHVGIARSELLILGQQTRGALAGEDAIALDVPAVVEASAVLVGPGGGDVMGRVGGGKGDVEEEGGVIAGGDELAQPEVGAVDDRFGEVVVVARLDGGGRVDAFVAEEEFGIPLAGLAEEESVEAVEAALQRPVIVWSGGRLHGADDEMPLAHTQGSVTAGFEHLGERAGLAGDEAGGVGEAVVHLGHASDADGVVIASGEQAGAGGRTERGDVKVGVAQPALGEAVERGGVDAGAVAAELGIADIVEHDDDDVGSGGCWLLVPGAL